MTIPVGKGGDLRIVCSGDILPFDGPQHGSAAGETEGGCVVAAKTDPGHRAPVPGDSDALSVHLRGGGRYRRDAAPRLCRGPHPPQGEGEPVFQSAIAALQRWEQFNLGWVEAWPSDVPIQKGEVVAVMGRAFGIWWLNACRVVYVVDEAGPISKFGFAYGTLPGHVESGEERFLIEWDRGDDGVWYDILAFSRPLHVLTRLGYPVVRRLQKRFGRDSAASMLLASARTTGAGFFESESFGMWTR